MSVHLDPSDYAARKIRGDRALVFATDTLTEANRIAVRTNRNRSLTDEFIDKLDPEGLHVVNMKLVHNDVEWRYQVMCKVKDSPDPVTVWIDVSFEDAQRLTFELVREHRSGNWHRV